MASQINPVRVVAIVVVSLLLFGVLFLVVTGQLPYLAASTAGYLRAKVDVLAGKRELQISSLSRGFPSALARQITSLGLPTTEHYYDCLTESTCGTYHRAYNAEVRRSIRRDFGYDIFNELEQPSAEDMSILIQHR